MRHRLLVLSLLAALPLTIIVESAEAKCLTVDEAANACRYPQGDAWCREKFSDGRRYAYRDNCQASSQTASSQPVPAPPPSPTRVVAPAVPKTPEQLKQEEIARLRAKVKFEQQAEAEREAQAAQQQAIAEQQAREQQMQQSIAGYWDCNIHFSSQRWDMVAYSGDITKEVVAEIRSAAESKALYEGLYLTKQGFLGSKDIYVCGKGNKEENGKPCYYGIRSASCSRQ